MLFIHRAATSALAIPGAKHHGLSQEYQDWLKSLEPFERKTIGTVLGGMAAAATSLAVAGAAIPAAFALGKARSMWSSPACEPSPADPPVSGPARSDVSATGSEWNGEQAVPIPATDETRGLVIRMMRNMIWIYHDYIWSPLLGRGK